MQQTTTPSTATDELGRNYEALHRLQGSLTRMYVQLTNLGGFSTTTDAALLRVLQRMLSDLLRFLVQSQGALIRPQTMFYFRYTYARRTRERKGDVTHSSILGDHVYYRIYSYYGKWKYHMPVFGCSFQLRLLGSTAEL